ncbi:MAG: HNH endonuclease signature motif containing protein [Saonia sp.]
MDELLDIFRNLDQDDYKLILFASIVVIFLFLRNWFRNYVWNRRRIRRQQYYRNVYLKSDDWRRKRYVVLKRDNWKCVYCGKRATQVHHTRYAKYNIGKEPIDWLESVCKSCHDSFH